MGEITEDLFDKLIRDALVRPDHDAQESKRKSHSDNYFSQEGLALNDRFKDTIFEIIARRARDFVETTHQEIKTNPKERYAYVDLRLIISDSTFHEDSEPEGIVKALVRGRAVVLASPYDSNSTRKRLEELDGDNGLMLGCGPN